MVYLHGLALTPLVMGYASPFVPHA